MKNYMELYELSITDIEDEIKMLTKIWVASKTKCRYPKFVDNYLKEINKHFLLAKNNDQTADIIMRRDLATIYEFINAPETLDLGMIMLNSNTADKIKTFAKYSSQMDDKTYWEELRSAYQLQDYKKLNHKLLANLFLAKRAEKDMIYTKSEKSIIKSLPEQVKIYRGCSQKEIKAMNYGISWTLDESVADYFANRVIKKVKGGVINLLIPKNRIVAYFKDRKEEEIIYIPDWLIV